MDMDVDEVREFILANCYSSDNNYVSYRSRKDWWIKRNAQHVMEFILDYTNFLPNDAKWITRIHHILHKTVVVPICSHSDCVNFVNWRGKKYTKYCSRQCASTSADGLESRSRTMTDLNLNNSTFQEARQRSCRAFYDSSRSDENRMRASQRAKLQHSEAGLGDAVRNYFNTSYKGSEDQKNRSKRMTENNPGADPEIRKKMTETYIANSSNRTVSGLIRKEYKGTGLIYQGTYEYDFLEYCFANGITDVQNAPILNDAVFSGSFYAPDFLINGEYIIEIKSWYIEKLQEEKSPGVTKAKQELTERSGYKWVYVKDKDYSVLDFLRNAL